MPFLAFGYFCLMQLYDPPEWLLPPGALEPTGSFGSRRRLGDGVGEFGQIRH